MPESCQKDAHWKQKALRGLLQDLLDLGIDLISTDDVAGLRAFVAARLVRQQRRRRRPLARWSLQQPALPRAFSLDIAVREMFGRRAAVWPAPNSP